MKTIEQISNYLFKLLDKLKLKSPIGFLFIQASLVVVAGLFSNGTFVIKTPSFLEKLLPVIGIESLNGLIMGVLVTLVALLGVHTSQKVKELKN